LVILFGAVSSQVTGTIAYPDADAENDEHAGYRA
jgi:hypothetical protein